MNTCSPQWRFRRYGALYGTRQKHPRGYAAAGTDDGHADPVGTDASWALGHPQKIIDFGFRALSVGSTDKAKTVIKAFAGTGPQYSYFAGCLPGGREALMEGQRYPNDFDGIVVGDPANNWIPHIHIWQYQRRLPRRPPIFLRPNCRRSQMRAGRL